MSKLTGWLASGSEEKRPSIREEQRLLTRERLLDAAYELFEKVGFRNATIDQVTVQAGINRATFYLHFKDKAELAAGLGRRAAAPVAKLFHGLDDMDNPTVEDIQAWVEQHSKAAKEMKLLAQMTAEANSSDPKFATEYVAYLNSLATVVMAKTLSRIPEGRREIVRAKIVLLQMMMERYTFHAVCQEIQFPAKDIFKAIAEMWKTEVFSNLEAGELGRQAKAVPKSTRRTKPQPKPVTKKTSKSG